VTVVGTPRPSKRQASHKRRKEIVEAASRVFHQKGYEGASIQDIAEEVGLLKGSLYYWIDSKEDLLYWSIKQMHESFVQVADGARDSQLPAIERLRHFIAAHTLMLAREVTKSAVFFRDFGHLEGERRDEILRYRHSYTTTVEELVESGQREGTVRADLTSHDIAVALLGMLNWTYTWYRAEGPRTPEEIGEGYAKLIIDGLRAA
jgi:AcrR family transcriptional regulator